MQRYRSLTLAAYPINPARIGHDGWVLFARFPPEGPLSGKLGRMQVRISKTYSNEGVRTWLLNALLHEALAPIGALEAVA